MHVAAAEGAGLEVACALESEARLGRGRKIGRAADERGKAWRKGIDHLGGRVPARNALGIGGEGRQVGVPAGGNLAGTLLFEVACFLRMLGAVGGHQLLPVLPMLGATLADAVVKMLAHTIGHEELRVFAPAVVALGKADLFGAQRLTVRGRGILPVRRAEADMAVDDDEGGGIRPAAEDCAGPVEALSE